MLNLCNDGHDEICYEGRICPLCREIKDKGEEIKELQKEVNEWKIDGRWKGDDR